MIGINVKMIFLILSAFLMKGDKIAHERRKKQFERRKVMKSPFFAQKSENRHEESSRREAANSKESKGGRSREGKYVNR